jgi:hypothetical protein
VYCSFVGAVIGLVLPLWGRLCPIVFERGPLNAIVMIILRATPRVRIL